MINLIINPWIWQATYWDSFLENKIVYGLDTREELLTMDHSHININPISLKQNVIFLHNYHQQLMDFYSIFDEWVINQPQGNHHIKYKNIYDDNHSKSSHIIPNEIITLDWLCNMEGYMYLVLILYKNHINDITFSINQNNVTIKIRYKGIYRLLGIISQDTYSQLVHRWIYQMELDSLSPVPQSGIQTYQYNNDIFQCRWSFYPTFYGIKTSIRILYNQYTNLQSLNLHPSIHEQLLDIIGHKTFICIGGPSSTGKTSLAYSIINQLHEWGLHIISLEKPIEYPSQNFDQSIESMDHHLLLPHLMRHDLDGIFVGEILDKATAQLAIEAMATGHSVIGTLHIQNIKDLSYRWSNLNHTFYKGYIILPKIYYGTPKTYMILEIYNLNEELLSLTYDEQLKYIKNNNR